VVLSVVRGGAAFAFCPGGAGAVAFAFESEFGFAFGPDRCWPAA